MNNSKWFWHLQCDHFDSSSKTSCRRCKDVEKMRGVSPQQNSFRGTVILGSEKLLLLWLHNSIRLLSEWQCNHILLQSAHIDANSGCDYMHYYAI